ncbi:MAG: ABC transporter ATP-binding protein [Acidaminococcaceae bacterium]
MTLHLTALSKTYDTTLGQLTALAPTTLHLPSGTFTCVVGKSGCGKTTLLRLLSGLEIPSSGKISFDETAPQIGYVFQEPRLMPWLTVAENMRFAQKSYPALATDSLAPLLELLGLTRFADTYPTQLSGGMAQRVALGRTLFQNPDLILMDEPFSALDYFTRRGLQDTLLRLFARERKTIIFVTHDVEEALLLGERVLIMQNGQVTADTPIALPYPRDPASAAIVQLRKQILTGLE